MDILQVQIDTVLSVIARSVVQRQILAFFLIIILANLLPEVVNRWRQKRDPSGMVEKVENISRNRRWLAALYHLLTPVLALVFLGITIWFFTHQGFPSGILQDLTSLILIWLIYRILVTLIYARYGEAAGPYQIRIVTPVFLIAIILRIVESLPGSITFVDAPIKLGAMSIALSSLVSALLLLYMTVVISWAIKQAMVQILPDRLNAEPGVIETVAILTRYTLLTVGISFSLNILGLNFTSLAIIAGGLSVGIGIGLQDIVSNFVSGLMLLFEQSLRPGDVVEVDGRISQVEEISLRATTLRTRTNEVLIIPNAQFTTQQVKNFTKSERLVMMLIPIGVSYKSDPELVRKLTTETSLHHPLVLAQPAPQLLFLGYGDSSLDFNLVVSVDRPEMMASIRSDIYYMIWKVFEEYDVVIPFPQRDLNLGDGWHQLTTDGQTP